MKTLGKVIVTVSQHTVFLAEAAISSCVRCSDLPNVPFHQMLEKVGNRALGEAVYFLPVLGCCPCCKVQLDEQTLVVPRVKRKW